MVHQLWPMRRSDLCDWLHPDAYRPEPVGGIKRADEEEADDDGLVFYYAIFPNMLLSLHPEYVMVHQLWPMSPERTLIVCDWFFHPDAFNRPDFKPDDAIEFLGHTNKQDVGTVP